MAGPLDALRVVDLTDLRGAMCGRILADLGADVVHIDVADATNDLITTTAYRYRHANKRGAGLDWEVSPDAEQLHALITGADVLVENLPGKQRQSWGLDPAAVTARHPHLVHAAITDFGLTGPRHAWHLEPLPALAAGGTLHASGFADRPPCGLRGYLAHDCASIYATVGVVAAVMDRSSTGLGQTVEVSTQEAALAGTIPWSVVLEDYLKVSPFLPAKGTRNADGTYWVLPAADGWVRTIIGNEKQWKGFLKLLGDPEVLSGREWMQLSTRIMNSDVIRMVADECLRDRTRAQLFAEARQIGATIGVIHTASEYVAHEQTRARDVFTSTGFSGLGEAPFVRPPLRLSRTPSSLRRPAPWPGEHADTGGSTWVATGDTGRVTGTRSGRPGPEHPERGLLLDGVRVVEFGMAGVGPEVSLVLSELGADVIKIESEAHLDVLRAGGLGRINCSFAFNAECRGRRSVALDLRTVEGRRLAFELCHMADVVVENYRGGVLDGLGLGYEAVQDANPSVVYVCSQGYGREGPLAEMPAYGPLNFGFVGQHLLWNHPDTPYPCGTSLNHPDHVVSKLLAIGALAAIHHRRRTGEGQLVEMAQTDAAAFLMGEIYLDAHLNDSDPAPRGNASEDAVPHGVYPAQGEDRWLAIAIHDDRAWERLCLALGWAVDDETATLAGRLVHRDAIDAALSTWSSTLPAEDNAAALQAVGVSAMPVMGPQDHLSDPHLLARGFIVTLEHPEVGSERHCGNPVRLSRLPQRTAQSAPQLGAHTEEVLTSVLGVTPAQVTALVESGVCR